MDLLRHIGLASLAILLGALASPSAPGQATGEPFRADAAARPHLAGGLRLPIAAATPAVDAAGATDTREPNGATETTDADDTGIWHIIVQSGWIGMLIVLALLASSITAGYLAVDHLMTVRASELVPADLAEQVTGMITQGRIAEAEQLCRQRPSFLAFVLANGLAEMPAGWSAMEKAMEDATADQAARLLRKIEYLAVIGNIAPMMGLLGTVTGMIIAFQKVATSQGTAGAAELAEGIYQALITTVAGLLVAIPSLAAFAVFRNRIDQLVAEAAYTAQHVFTPWKHRKVRAVTPPPTATPLPPGREQR